MEATLPAHIDDLAEIARGRLRNSPYASLRTLSCDLGRWWACCCVGGCPVSTISSWPRKRCDDWPGSGRSSMRPK